MSEVPVKKERTTIYNTYSDEDRRRYFYFIQQKLMKPSEAAKASNVNYEAARKWVTEYNKDPENTKKGRVVGTTKRKAAGEMAPTIPKGTTSDHYVQFISDTMDVVDEFPYMKAAHIVMNNARIHSTQLVDPVIIERDYIPIYLPPYSPELNPIGVFWKVLKDKVRRTPLTSAETLSSRITEGDENVPFEHLQNFVQHSIDYFPRCLNKEPL